MHKRRHRYTNIEIEKLNREEEKQTEILTDVSRSNGEFKKQRINKTEKKEMKLKNKETVRKLNKEETKHSRYTALKKHSRYETKHSRKK